MSGIPGTRRQRQAQRLLGFGSVYLFMMQGLAIQILSITRRMYVLRDKTDKLTAEIFYYVKGNPASFQSPAID